MKISVNRERLAELHKHYNIITSSVGGIVDGRIMFCGHDVTNELAGSVTQTEAFLLWALGRKPSPLETRLVDTLICINLYPDLRIWSIRSAAYACRRFFLNLHAASQKRPLEQIITDYVRRNVFFPGFGRPLIDGPDERYRKIQVLLREWEYPLGELMRMLYALAPMLLDGKGLHPNYASLLVCLLLDPPFFFDDSRLAVLVHYLIELSSYVTACEIRDLSPGTPLLPLKTTDIKYTGKSKRRLKDGPCKRR